MLTLRFTTQIDLSDQDSLNDLFDQLGSGLDGTITYSTTQIRWETDEDFEITLTGLFDLPPTNREPTQEEIDEFYASPFTGFVARHDDDGSLFFSITGIEGQSLANFDSGTWRGRLLSQIQDGFAIFGSGSGDVLVGDVGPDELMGNGGADDLRGVNGDDTLNGGSGSDKLNGGAGIDTMIGGIGNDTYYISTAGDRAVENAGEGTDLVYSNRTFTLQANVENLTLQGTTNINGTGNELLNKIIGNSFKNTLAGLAGNDTLDGGSGDDTLDGGSGNDTLQGGAGTDVLRGGSGNDSLDGGTGNDTLHGDNGNDTLLGTSGFDTLNGGAGTDLLDGGDSTDTLNGGDGSDTLIGGNGADTLNGGPGSDELLGGTANDILSGGAGNDKLDGGTGNDVMTGGGDNDRYFVDSAGDQVVESLNAGIDKLISSISLPFLPANVENVSLIGSADLNAEGNLLDNDMVGNTGDNMLNGRKGNDTIHLGQGNDTGTGGEGSDSFVLDAAIGATEADAITDFAAGTDTLVLDNAIFAALGAGALNAGQFILTTDTPAGGDDFLVYDEATGSLYYDADGTGTTAVLIATFGDGTTPVTLTAADIEVI